MKRTDYFEQVKKRFSSTDEDPLYGGTFYLEDVQLQDIEGDYTDWLTVDEFTFDKYYIDRPLLIGKDLYEWRRLRKQISDDYCEGLNKLMKGRITPFKQVVSLKIHYMGEKGVSHVFNYNAPRIY